MMTPYVLCWCLGAVVPDAWVDALALIESGGNALAIGRHGERSEWQITPQVWRLHSRVPFERAGRNVRLGVVKQVWADRVLAFEWRHGRRPSAEEAYLLWHRPARVLRPRPVERERAVRFGRLVEVGR